MSTPTTDTVSIPSAWSLDWVALDTTRDGNVGGPVWKVLREDPASGGLTYLMHLPPGWHDQDLDWHPTVEEGYKLAGATILGDNYLGEGSYLYRPPGILHGPVSAPSDDGATILQRMSGEIRILRYDGDEFPHRHMQPITDQYKDWPVPWSEKIDTTELPWEPVTSGGWAGTRVRWIYRNGVTQGGAVLLELPAGWSGSGSAARGPVEEFVVSGAVTAGGIEYDKWGYAYRPAGSPAGHYATAAGALMFCWWDAASEID